MVKTRKAGCVPPMVLIEWLDSSQAAPQWQLLSELKPPGVVRCVSVGFLVKDDAREKALAISLGDADCQRNAQAAGVISIPSRAVISMRRIICPSWGDPGVASRPNRKRA